MAVRKKYSRIREKIKNIVEGNAPFTIRNIIGSKKSRKSMAAAMRDFLNSPAIHTRTIIAPAAISGRETRKESVWPPCSWTRNPKSRSNQATAA